MWYTKHVNKQYLKHTCKLTQAHMHIHRCKNLYKHTQVYVHTQIHIHVPDLVYRESSGRRLVCPGPAAFS